MAKAKAKAHAVGHARNADGTAHVVVINNLQVLITERDGCYFAQGLEIDYAAEGRDVDDVRRAFEYGLAQTINAHLRQFGSIERLQRSAPPDVLETMNKSTIRNRFCQVSAHIFPFTIQFLQAA